MTSNFVNLLVSGYLCAADGGVTYNCYQIRLLIATSGELLHLFVNGEQ